MHKLKLRAKTIFSVVVVGLLLVTAVPQVTAANNDSDPTDNVGASSLEQQLMEIEKQLAQIRKYQQDLNGQISNKQYQVGVYSGEIGKLSSQVETLQLSVAELDLQNQELQINIDILEQKTEEKKLEIEENEGQVLGLQVQTDERIRDNYMDYRLNKRLSSDFFTVKDANTYFRDSQYREIIQDNTNQVLVDLNDLRQKLDRDKEELAESSKKVRRDREILGEQQEQLERLQTDLEAEIKGFYDALYAVQGSINSSKQQLVAASAQEAKKAAEAEKIRQELFNSFNSIPAGHYVLAGTQIGRQGSTGWSTGPHLHFSVTINGSQVDPCGALPAAGGVGGCGWGGNALQWPLHGVFYFTSGFGWRQFDGYPPHFHDGVDIAHSIWNAPIYAAHDGWLLKGVDQYGALYIVICQNSNNCNAGYKTGYWHMSEY